MAIKKIRKNDEIIVLAGKDKGRTGKVIAVVEERVRVEGINLVKKHVKPNPNKNIQGGIVDKEAFIHVSNVAILNAKTKKADKVSTKVLNDGKKVRVFKSNQEQIDV